MGLTLQLETPLWPRLSACFNEGCLCRRNCCQTGINLCGIGCRLHPGNPGNHVSVDATDQWLLIGRNLEKNTPSPPETTQQWRPWVRRLSNSNPSQAVSGVHHTPIQPFQIGNDQPTTLVAIDGLRVQLFNCDAPSANMAANLLTSEALPTSTATRMSD